MLYREEQGVYLMREQRESDFVARLPFFPSFFTWEYCIVDYVEASANKRCRTDYKCNNNNKVQRHTSGLESASYVTTGIYGRFELMLPAHGRSPTSSFLLCSLFCDVLDLPQGAYLDFPSPREWEMAAGRYRTLLAAYVIQPQDILLRLPNERLYIGPHVQEYLVGLVAEWEKRLTRWTLGVQSALKAGGAPPPFSTAMTASPERTNRTLESDPLHTGPAEQGGAA